VKTMMAAVYGGKCAVCPRLPSPPLPDRRVIATAACASLRTPGTVVAGDVPASIFLDIRRARTYDPLLMLSADFAQHASYLVFRRCTKLSATR